MHACVTVVVREVVVSYRNDGVVRMLQCGLVEPCLWGSVSVLEEGRGRVKCGGDRVWREVGGGREREACGREMKKGRIKRRVGMYEN